MFNITLDFDTSIKMAYAATRCNFSAPWAVVRRIYSCSTEITEDYLEKFDFDGKRIITVGSSGDQVLTYAYLGSRDITLMDANPLTPFFVNLKIAALKVLMREEFMAFFMQDNEQYFMNIKLYEKVCSKLDEETKNFWNKLYEDGVQNKIFHIYSGVTSSSLPPYLVSDEEYDKVKDSMDNVKLTFYNLDISTFHEFAEGEYDFIDLSNIYTYVSSEKYWNSVNNLYQHLSREGYLKLHYCDSDEVSNFSYLDKQAFTVNVKGIEDNSFIIWQNDEYLYNQNHVGKTFK